MIYLHSDNTVNIGAVLSLQIQKMLGDTNDTYKKQVCWCLSYIVGSIFALNKVGAVSETMKGVRAIFSKMGFTAVSVAEVVDISGTDVIYITVNDIVLSMWMESKIVGIHYPGDEVFYDGMNGVRAWVGQ